MRQEFWWVLGVMALICLLPLIAVTLGPREDPTLQTPIVHSAPAEQPVAGVVILPEDGMYQEVRIDRVCVSGLVVLVARTPGSVTPVSIAELGVECD